MGDDEIVFAARRHPRSDVLVKKANALAETDAFFGERQHAFARVNAIDFDIVMRLEKFTEEAAIPLAHDQRPARRCNFIETSDPDTLQRISKSDGFESSIPRRDGIEAHNVAKVSTKTGVNKTKSASAVRWSTSVVFGNVFSQNNSKALAPMQPKIIVAERKRIA